MLFLKEKSIYASKLQFKCSGKSVFDQESCYKELPCKVNQLWQAQMLLFSPNQWLDGAQSDHATMISTFSALIGKHICPIICTEEMHVMNSIDHWIAQKISSLIRHTSIQVNRIIWILIICHILATFSYQKWYIFSLCFVLCFQLEFIGLVAFLALKIKKVDILLSEIIY